MPGAAYIPVPGVPSPERNRRMKFQRILCLLLCLVLLLAVSCGPARVLPQDDPPSIGENPGTGETPGTGEGNPGTGETPGTGEGNPGTGETPGTGEGNPGTGETPGAGEDNPGIGETPGTGEDKPDTGITPGVNAFRLILCEPDRSQIIKEPCGVYSYYGVGETLMELVVPYTTAGEKTIYDCLVAYAAEHPEIEFRFEKGGGYLFLSDITLNGQKLNTGTNYLILYNGEYCEYCLDNISPAGKDGLFAQTEDNLIPLTLIRDAWCSGTMS